MYLAFSSVVRVARKCSDYVIAITEKGQKTYYVLLKKF